MDLLRQQVEQRRSSSGTLNKCTKEPTPHTSVMPVTASNSRGSLTTEEFDEIIKDMRESKSTVEKKKLANRLSKRNISSMSSDGLSNNNTAQKEPAVQKEEGYSIKSSVVKEPKKSASGLVSANDVAKEWSRLAIIMQQTASANLDQVESDYRYIL